MIPTNWIPSRNGVFSKSASQKRSARRMIVEFAIELALYFLLLVTSVDLASTIAVMKVHRNDFLRHLEDRVPKCALIILNSESTIAAKSIIDSVWLVISSSYIRTKSCELVTYSFKKGMRFPSMRRRRRESSIRLVWPRQHSTARADHGWSWFRTARGRWILSTKWGLYHPRLWCG